MALVEEGPAAAQVAAERVGGAAAERHDPLLAALADRADEPLLEVDAVSLEADRLADAQARAVEELDERAVAQGARRRSVGRLDEPLRLAGRERARQAARPARQADSAAGLSVAGSDQDLVAEERADGGQAARDRRRGEPARAQLGEVALELLARRAGEGLWPSQSVERGEVAPVRLDRPRRQPRRRDREEALDLRICGWARS